MPTISAEGLPGRGRHGAATETHGVAVDSVLSMLALLVLGGTRVLYGSIISQSPTGKRSGSSVCSSP